MLRWKNTISSYGVTAKTFHWVMAVLILAMLLMGFFMDGLENSPFKFSIFSWHKSIGTLVLILAMLRLSWKFINIAPAHLPSHQKWEITLAKIVHVLLYVVMIAMPLSGWIMSSAGDFRYSFFGLFDMPQIVPKNDTIFKIAIQAHAIIAYAIIVFVGLHIAGALKHHFLDRDETIKRMTTMKFGFKSGVVLTLVLAIIFLRLATMIVFKPEEPAEAPEQTAAVEVIEENVAPVAAATEGAWAIDHAQSKIEFSVTQYGTPFTGNFENFEGTIVFDPKNLADSKADITIDIASLKTGSDDRDGSAKGPEWFDTTQFPQAQFQSGNFESLGDNKYVARGTLTIRGVANNVDLPFTLDIAERRAGGPEAMMDGTLVIDRQAYGIGQGQWKSADVIGNDVTVGIRVVAHRPDLQ